MTAAETPMTGEIPLPGYDVGEGLTAYAQPTRPDGTFERDRAGRPKVRRVRVRAAESPTPHRPEGLSDPDWQWCIREPHRWPTVVRRFGDNADHVSRLLARAGCVQLEHSYKNGSIQQPPLAWIPHPDLAAEHERAHTQRRAQADVTRQHAAELAQALEGDYPGVATALRTTTGNTLPWLVNAARDLHTGRSHHGPRAFVQHHAGHTKAREDLPRLLLDAGFEPDALEALGVARNPYIGLGGPIRLRYAERVIDLTGWAGPFDVRLPATASISVHVRPETDTLLVIENRQAAEYACDKHPDVPVIWCHGQPAHTALAMISQAALGARRTLICPDADLGGIRIAARIHDHLPPNTTPTVIDCGIGSHVAGASFSALTKRLIADFTERQDPVGRLAQACLDRGYGVEQEASVRAAISRALTPSTAI